MKIQLDHSISSRKIVQLLTAQLEAQVSGVVPNKDTYNKALRFNKILAEFFNDGIMINGRYIPFAIDITGDDDNYQASVKLYITSTQTEADLEFVWDSPDEYPRLIIGSYSLFNQIMDACERQIES